jgi:hypothetical protein
MARVKGLRGVCLGVERHLVPDEVTEIADDSFVQYLVSIGAVEVVPDAPIAEPETQVAETETDLETESPRKRGKKE